MADRRERVTFEFNSDGTKLESGISGLERKAARLADEQKKVNSELKKAGGLVKEARGHGGDFASGFRDITEGRVANGLFRFTSGLNLSAGAAVGAVVGVTLLQKGIESLRESAAESQKEMDALRESSMKLGKEAVFSGSARGFDALVKMREEAREQMHKAQDRVTALDPEGTKGIFGKAAGGAAEAFMQVRAYMQLTTLTQQQREAGLQLAQAQKVYQEATNQSAEALRDELNIQGLIAKGKTLEAEKAKLILEYEKKRQETVAEFGGKSPQADALLKTYQTRIDLIQKQIDLRDIQFEQDADHLSVWGLINSKAERQAALLKSQIFYAEEKRKISKDDFEFMSRSIALQELSRQQREDVRSRFFTPQGMPVNPAQITLERQQEARVQRRIDRWMNTHNPVTGKPLNRNVTPPRMANDDWQKQFTPAIFATHMGAAVAKELEKRTLLVTRK